MEDLTPELERRIQVEELWGRRVVLEETMNALRFREYQSRRLLSLLRSENYEQAKLPKSLPSSCANGIQSARPSAIFGAPRAAIIAALALFCLFAGQQAYARFFAATRFPEAHETSMSPGKIGSQIEARTPKLDENLLKHSASKLRPLDADLKRIFGSSL
jgi:hypothetical protein